MSQAVGTTWVFVHVVIVIVIAVCFLRTLRNFRSIECD